MAWLTIQNTGLFLAVKGHFSLEVQVAVLLQPLHSEFTVASPGTPRSYCHRHTPLTHPQSSLHSTPLASCLHPLNRDNGNTPIGCHVFQNSTYNLFEFQPQHYHFSAHWAFHFRSFVHQPPLQLSTVIKCRGGIILVCRVAGRRHVAVCAWAAWETPVWNSWQDWLLVICTCYYTAIYALLS